MESKKDIGKAFKEKLDLLQRQPSDAVWDSIRSDLNKKKPKALPLWLRLWTVAGVFLLVAFFTYPLWKNHVPHIYIKMPDQENEQVTGKDNNSPSTYSPGTNTEQGHDTENNGIDKDKITDASENPTDGKTVSTVEKGALPSATGSGSEYGNEITHEASAIKREYKKQQNSIQHTNSAASAANKRKNYSPAKASDNTDRPADYRIRNVADNTLNNNRITGNKKQNITGRENSINNNVSAGENSKKNNKDSAEEDIDEGFVVPMSAAYKSYRNNIARTVVIDSIANDSVEADSGKDFAKVTDSLRKMQSTGVKDVLKVPDTKKESGSDKGIYIYGFAAPTKYTFAENAGYIDPGLQDKSTSSKSSLAFGAYIGYNINRKLGVRVGAIKSKVELTTNNVFISAPDFEGIEYSAGISNTSIAGQMLQDPAETLSIRNNYEFIEVPVELTYNLYENQIGISVLGGFITRFTTDNTVFAQNDTGAMEIGKMKEIKDMSNGLSLGGSFYYKILPNLQLNVEPVYKYFFNDDRFIKQHTYSIQAGLQFNFGPGKQK